MVRFCVDGSARSGSAGPCTGDEYRLCECVASYASENRVSIEKCTLHMSFKAAECMGIYARKKFLVHKGVTIHSQVACMEAGEERRPEEGRVSKNLRTRSQADADSWNELFDTQNGP